MKLLGRTGTLFWAIVILLQTAPAGAENIVTNVSPYPDRDIYISDDSKPTVLSEAVSGSSYHGHLRVYVVEPESRWTDNTGVYNYEFGFIGFGIDSLISVAYQDTLQVTRTWDVSQNYLIDEISPDNIMVIGVMFNAAGIGTGYSDPYWDHPEGAPYTIYPVDAAAAAEPGIPGSNVSDVNSTHTVFVEEGTSQTCPNCPFVRAALSSLYASGEYNFLYAAMITDQGANGFMTDNYNLYWLPTCYFDGGDEILVGGYSEISYYQDRILAAGQREVHNLDFDISAQCQGNSTVQFTVTIVNNEFSNTAPEAPGVPTGPGSGLLEDQHTFSAAASDPDGNELYYMWNWGDQQSAWDGPYNSGQVVSAGYTWTNGGIYSVSVKVKDSYDMESAWSDAASIKVVARGNANADSLINVGDAVYMINYVFRDGAPPDPVEAGNANCDEWTNVGDAVYLINYVFKEGPPPGCR